MINIDLTNVTESNGEYDNLKPGGYVCKIVSATNQPENERLMIEYDIAEGEYKDYFDHKHSSTGYWFGDTIRSYKKKALPFFKAFITAVEGSNPGYKWNGDERSLVGKLVGFVVRNKEYINGKGELKTRLEVAYCHSIDKIRRGDFRLAADVKVQSTNSYRDMPANLGMGLGQQPQEPNIPVGGLGDFVEIDTGNDLPWV